jgi:hypothetical protein
MSDQSKSDGPINLGSFISDVRPYPIRGCVDVKDTATPRNESPVRLRRTWCH